MNTDFVERLIDPLSGGRLRLEVDLTDAEGAVLEGTLRAEGAAVYPVRNGIPRFVLDQDDDQSQTNQSFGFKWHQVDSYDSPRMRREAQQWLMRRLGFVNVDEMTRHFESAGRILDAGCGGGFSASLWMREGGTRVNYVGADISNAVDVARARLGNGDAMEFVQADVLKLPFPEASFDLIFSEGVLHHTPSTERSFNALVSKLAPGGELITYIYRRKGPIREFADDHIRGIVSEMEPQAAWDALRPLTKLGQALAELKMDVNVPEDIPFLGIKAGKQDVQRLIYWNFAKLFWNPEFNFDENHHVNFDWYHPRYARRHTPEEIRHWCDENGLDIRHLDLQESGMTLRAIRA